MASCAARLMSAGAEKSGNPCARLTASYCIACRVISRITDSVKCSTLSERKCLGWAETWVMRSSLAQETLTEGQPPSAVQRGSPQCAFLLWSNELTIVWWNDHQRNATREIAISEFKAKCLAVLERVRSTRTPIRVTRFG